MPPRRKSRKRRSAPPKPNYRLKVALAALFLLGFLVGSLVLLSELSEHYRADPAPPPASAPADVPEAAPSFDRLRPGIEEAMVQSGFSVKLPTTPQAGGAVRVEVPQKFPDAARVSGFLGRLKNLSPRLLLEENPAERELRITWNGRPRFLLHFQPSERIAPSPEWAGGPRLAIIMDDLGRDTATARELLLIDLAVTFSILPNTAQAARVATLANRRGREVLIHLPMEPKGYPENNPGTDALFLDLAPEEIRRRVRTYLDVIPYATGGNNHMGSLFTESSRGMKPVLEVMREEGLFFVDSVTSARSVAYAEARRAGIPAAMRDVFLDNERDVELILRQIRTLAAQAVLQGQAVGICHPYPETLEALRRAVPYLTEGEVTVVPVSHLLAR